MGFNIAGLVVKGALGGEQELERLLESKITYLQKVDFEAATSSFRDENTVDVLQTHTGAFIVTELGRLYDLTNFQNEAIQFMVSDVSSTYYFAKYSGGQLVRKQIVSEGKVIEDAGEGVISGDNDLIEEVWQIVDEYLQTDFTKNQFSLRFKRYRLG